MQITNYKVNKNIMNSVAVTKSLIGAKLPYELVEYIWSFNYFWASNIIQKYTDDKNMAERPPLGAPQGSFHILIISLHFEGVFTKHITSLGTLFL